MKLINKNVIAVLGLLFGNVGHAAIIFDNGLPDLLNGRALGTYFMAEDFSLGVETTITDIRFWSLEFPGTYIDLATLLWTPGSLSGFPVLEVPG